MQFNPSRLSSLFTDTRKIHAPMQVVINVLVEYLDGCGFQTEAFELAKREHKATYVAEHRSSSARRLLDGKPKRISFTISAQGQDTTIVQACPTYGRNGEAVLAAVTVAFWSILWLAWHVLISYRHELQDGGRFAHVGVLVPALSLGALWVLGFTRLWFIGFRPYYFIEDFYKHLTDDIGLQHYAEHPMSLPFSAIAQNTIITLGLVAIIHRLTWEISAGGRNLLLAILGPLCVMPYLIMTLRHGIRRWLIGHAAFTTATALILYTFFPLIVLAVSADELKQIGSTRPGMVWLSGSGLVLAAIGLWLLYTAVSHAAHLLRAVDYRRTHPEGQRWAGPWQRAGLGLIACPLAFLVGFLMTFGVWHCCLFVQSRFLGSLAWPHAIGFDQAADVVGMMLRPILGQVVGTPQLANFGGWMIVIYVGPVVFWGCCHVWAFVREAWHYCLLWRLPRLPNTSPLPQTLEAISRSAGLRFVTLRLSSSPYAEAYAAIAPLPLLPRVIVISEGAIRLLPRDCAVALLAHEVGHLRHAHTALYTCLRLVSRLLMMGPSLFTGLIKPSVTLEAQADAFAVAWLESNGRPRQHLIDALRLIEREDVSSFLQQGLREGIAISNRVGADWLPHSLRTKIDQEDTQTLGARFLSRWQLLHYMTFHCDLADYSYASLSERLSTIQALPTQEAQE